MSSTEGFEWLDLERDLPTTGEHISAPPPPRPGMGLRAPGAAGYGPYLLANGFRVEGAHTSAMGIERATALRPDRIVLDFGLDGKTVARLRREPATHGIPLIALTTLADLHGARVHA